MEYNRKLFLTKSRLEKEINAKVHAKYLNKTLLISPLKLSTNFLLEIQIFALYKKIR